MISYGYKDQMLSDFCIREPNIGSEEDLVNQWVQLKPGTVIVDHRGSRIFICRPGEVNRYEGPDVLNAVLMVDGQLLEGAVECHLAEQSWFHHGHHHNPDYEQVILHAVRFPSPNRSPGIRMVILAPNVGLLSGTGCTLDPRNVKQQSEDRILMLAEIRWARMVERFMGELEAGEGINRRHYLVKAAFHVLGYGGNSKTFEQLAQRTDYQQLEKMNETEGFNYLDIRARSLAWHKRGIRPENHPRNRLLLAHRLVRFIDLRFTQTPITVSDFQDTFEENITQHCGAGMRVELLGNVFYPYLAVQSLLQRDYKSFEVWKRNWFSLVLPNSYGIFSRRFHSIYTARELRKFSFLQGLKTLDTLYCDPGHCSICPLKVNYGDSE